MRQNGALAILFLLATAIAVHAQSARVPTFGQPIGGIAVGDDENGNYVEKPVDFRKNSRLVVVHGIPGTQIDRESYPPTGDYFYEWKKNRLRLIRSVPKK